MKKQGFTLMEILIAVSIIAILSIIGITAYSSINQRSRDAKRKSDLEQVRAALEMYRTASSNYPSASTTFEPLTALSGDLVPTYLPSIPTDPKYDATYPYSYAIIGNAPYYNYCICGKVESDSGKNDCQALGAPVIANCNYYVRNP